VCAAQLVYGVHTAVVESKNIFVPRLVSASHPCAHNKLTCARTPANAFAQRAKFADVMRHAMHNRVGMGVAVCKEARVNSSPMRPCARWPPTSMLETTPTDAPGALHPREALRERERATTGRPYRSTLLPIHTESVARVCGKKALSRVHRQDRPPPPHTPTQRVLACATRGLVSCAQFPLPLHVCGSVGRVPELSTRALPEHRLEVGAACPVSGECHFPCRCGCAHDSCGV